MKNLERGYAGRPFEDPRNPQMEIVMTPWYHGVKWSLKSGYRGRTMAVENVCRVYERPDWQERNRIAELIAAAPEIAQERDTLKAEVERKDRALRLAEGRLAMLMSADLPESDHPGATQCVLDHVRAALTPESGT
jgi:hypothetical protein